MVDHDALTAAVIEASALDPRYVGPSNIILLRPSGFGLNLEARNRMRKGLRDHSNAVELSGLLMPCGDGTVEEFDLDMVAAWLIWEAKRRPASEVVADFAYFLDHRKVEGLKIELIHGLQIATSIDLGASLRLEPFPKLPASWQARVFAERRELEHAATLLDWVIRLL
jgi:hypothetical protein